MEDGYKEAGVIDKEMVASAAVGRTWRSLGRRWRMWLGAAIVAVAILVALSAAFVAPFDPNRIDLARTLEAPGRTSWLGTDDLGRDVASRIIYGTRVSLGVAVSSVGLAMLVGSILGLTAGVLKGWSESLIMRGMDAILAIPALLLAIGLSAALGAGITNVTIAIAVVYVPSFARLVHGQVLSLREREFVLATEVLGASRSRVAVSHILPNTLSSVVALGSLRLSSAVLAEASLSFLGLGVQPPTASWGSMVSLSRRFLEVAPWTVFGPGVAIFVLVMGVTLLGDGVRDVIDPRDRATARLRSQ